MLELVIFKDIKMDYDQLWHAIDKIAQQNGLSLSGLAKKSGLDATTFNKSKRMRPDGKKRWPSFDSVNKILDTCHLNLADFYYLAENKIHSANYLSIPYILLSSLKNPKKFSPQNIDTKNWQMANLPFSTENTYAIDLDSTKFEPMYHFGAKLVVEKFSKIKKHDRVILLLKNGDALIQEFIACDNDVITLQSVTEPRQKTMYNRSDIKLLNKIIWASQ